MTNYSPMNSAYPCFTDAIAGFRAGTDTPRVFLERGLEAIALREPDVRAFVALRLEEAREEADASTLRWRKGQPLSPLDGLPLAVKDCFDVAGLPTRVNSALFAKAQNAAFDAAHVFALRRGGAVVVGKTVTTELTMAAPGPTRNPWDLSRTPGGSSSGSAAAVAAGMVPLASGSQVRGSGIRPASICGIIALKPTFGSLNRHGGFDPSPSINHLALLGGNLADIWNAAGQVSSVVGGDPGCQAFPRMALPAAVRPLRLARQYTAGWPLTDEASKETFEQFLRRAKSLGIEIVEPEDSPDLLAYERETAAVPEFFFDLMLWEARWPLMAEFDKDASRFSDTMQRHIKNAAALSVDAYEIAQSRRERLRKLHRNLEGKVDAFVTLAHIGPGQKGDPSMGTPWYNDASSAIGAPSFNLPLLSVEDVPLGVQLMGFEGRDAPLTAIARWFLDGARAKAE